jgi:sugar O-acyltransferase (sialic acid O-acetyltransferase NeuD family)
VTRTPVFLFGAGGHGRVVFDVIQRQGRYEVVAVLDDASQGDAVFFEIPVMPGTGFPELVRGGPRLGVVAIGNNRERASVVRRLAGAGLEFATVVDPSVQIGRDVTIGPGTVVMPGVVVNVGVRIGAHVILNTSCSVDHDCRIESLSHLSPGVHLGGQCTIGEEVHVGIGASVMQGIRIGNRVTIGAGAAVVADVPDGVVAAGVPARIIRSEPR